MSDRKRYAVVGLGGRSRMFTRALLDTYKDTAELVGFCDTNQTRMDYWNQTNAKEFGSTPVSTYKDDRFDEMIAQQNVDCVIVTTMDSKHHQYICRAMELGCDVISEKPMTTDAQKCQQVLDTQARTGKKLTVTFNYRYPPRHAKVKELLQEGAIGKIVSVHFEWLLNTNHGADYFRRWHRDKNNSGGLMVHKATHHFDMVNWWLDSAPQTVFAMGGLNFYGKENARQRGVTEFYDRSHGSDIAKQDPFGLDMKDGATMQGLYLNAEHEDGYHRDQSVFGEGITIEDDMALLVRYRNQATMSYHLNAFAPWEGFRIAFNGTEGRLELLVNERSYVSSSEDDHNFARNVQGASEQVVTEPAILTLQRHWEKPRSVELPQTNSGGHGGGDALLLRDLFDPTAEPDPLGRSASHVDGAMSILTGIAANQCFKTGQPVDIDSLVTFHEPAAV